jgi:CMP-N-acetylneuraminic acid synthetase
LQEQRFISEETIAFPMPAEKSLDIDSEADLFYGSYLLSQIKP